MNYQLTSPQQKIIDVVMLGQNHKQQAMHQSQVKTNSHSPAKRQPSNIH